MQERRYDIRSLIARGGMAEVWLATLKGVDGFQKKVVLKTILPKLAEDPEFVRMFINEALVAARLSHPNVVQIQDLGKIKGQYYIAMEYVYGRSLRQIARQCRKGGSLIPPWFLLRVMGTVCEGLQYAHDFAGDDSKPLGLVHRDVTPENIMVSFMGEVKILDFGVAKATTAATETRAGLLKGKYAYISPEQIKGKKPDRRCDIYSVGVILYELLTGTRPFKGANELALLRQVLAGDFVKPKEIAPWIPDELQQIILHALESDPDKRYLEINQLGNDIQALLQLARDHHSNKDLGMFVGSLFPEETNVKSDVKKLSTGTLSLSPTSSPGSLSAFLTSGSNLSPELEDKKGLDQQAISELPEQDPIPEITAEPLVGSEPEAGSDSEISIPVDLEHDPQTDAAQEAESTEEKSEDKKAVIKQKARSWFRRVVGTSKAEGEKTSEESEIVDLSEPPGEDVTRPSAELITDSKQEFENAVPKKPAGPEGWTSEVTAKTKKPLGSRRRTAEKPTASTPETVKPPQVTPEARPTQPTRPDVSASGQAAGIPHPIASPKPTPSKPSPAAAQPAPVVQPTPPEGPVTEEMPALPVEPEPPAVEAPAIEAAKPKSTASVFSDKTTESSVPQNASSVFDSNATASEATTDKVADLFGAPKVESFMDPGDAFSASPAKDQNSDIGDGATSIFDLYSGGTVPESKPSYGSSNPFATAGADEDNSAYKEGGSTSFAIRETPVAEAEKEELIEEDHSTDVNDSPAALASQHFENGLAAVRAGKLEEALQDWQSAVKLDPDNRMYRMNIKKLMERLEREAN